MKTLDHPNIIKLYETFEDWDHVYLVFELCKGGELFGAIIEKGHFHEAEARSVFNNILKALHHCHKNGVCHRDLKPENFLLAEKNDISSVKMIDFGLSAFFKSNKSYLKNNRNSKENFRHSLIQKTINSQMIKKFSTLAGTSYYIAPEVIKGRYDELCDIWSAGVILYVLLVGYPPF